MIFQNWEASGEFWSLNPSRVAFPTEKEISEGLAVAPLHFLPVGNFDNWPWMFLSFVWKPLPHYSAKYARQIIVLHRFVLSSEVEQFRDLF